MADTSDIPGAGSARPTTRSMTVMRHSRYTVEMASVFVSIQGRGTIALPADVRRRLRLDEPGAQVEVVVRDEDVFELHPCLPVAASQAWFWSRAWQEREREVDEALAAGDVATHGSVEELLEHLDGDEA
ncbi:MAG: hypothetical protein ACKOSO_07515 [Actinomycetota bacterium]